MKTINEIQEENRKLILEATLTGNNLRVLKEGIGDFANVPLTLSRLLLVLKNKPRGLYYFFDLQHSCLCELLDGYYDGSNVELFAWNLEKETLEEQSEETQISINKLLKRE